MVITITKKCKMQTLLIFSDNFSTSWSSHKAGK